MQDILKRLKQITFKVLYYFWEIKQLHIELRVDEYAPLRPWIFSRNVLFLYSLIPSIFKYLLITYLSIKEIYPIFFITGIISFLLSCALTVVIQQKWYAWVSDLEDGIKKTVELKKLEEAENIKKGIQTNKTVSSMSTIPFAYSKKTIIVIFAIIAFILCCDYMFLYWSGNSLIRVIITAIIIKFFK